MIGLNRIQFHENYMYCTYILYIYMYVLIVNKPEYDFNVCTWTNLHISSGKLGGRAVKTSALVSRRSWV